MRNLIHYIPIITTLFSIVFAVVLYHHWRAKPTAYYLMWWFIGVVMYGIGTLTESITTLWGWQLPVFKAWYISGALLGGAPLAQGTVYLFFSEERAHLMSYILIAVVVAASWCVLWAPVEMALVEPYRLSGKVFEWQWVRLFSPFINTYAFIFLCGGAAWSALKYWRQAGEDRSRVWGNVFIAFGALLPGIGGASARMDYVEVLYVTELIGLLLIWIGYRKMRQTPGRSIHQNQLISE